MAGMQIPIQVVDALSVKKGGTALDAVNFVTLVNEQLSQVRTVLTSNPRYQSLSHRIESPSCQCLFGERYIAAHPRPEQKAHEYLMLTGYHPAEAKVRLALMASEIAVNKKTACQTFN